MCAPLKRFSESWAEGPEEKKVAKSSFGSGRNFELFSVVQPVFMRLFQLGFVSDDSPGFNSLNKIYARDQSEIQGEERAQVEQALGNWLAEIKNDGQPPEACPLYCLKSRVDQIIREKIAHFLDQIPLGCIDREKYSTRFPLCKAESKSRALPLNEVWEILHDFIKNNPAFANSIKGPLELFFRRLIVKKIGIVIENQSLNDVLKKIISLNFFESESLLSFFLQLLKEAIDKLELDTENPDFDSYENFYHLCKVAGDFCNENEIRFFLNKTLKQEAIDWLKENSTDIWNRQAIFMCEYLLKFLDPNFKVESEWTIELKDGSLISLSAYEVACLIEISPYLYDFFFPNKNVRRCNLTELEIDQSDLELFLKLHSFFNIVDPCEEDLKQFIEKFDQGISDRYAKIKTFLKKAISIESKSWYIFFLLKHFIPKSPQDVFNFLEIQEKVPELNSSKYLTEWLKLRDAHLSEALSHSLSDQIFSPENYLNEILWITEKYSEPQDEWMHVQSLTVTEGIFPSEMLARLKKLKSLTVTKNLNLSKYPPLDLQMFPCLTFFKTSCLSIANLTQSRTLETLEFEFNPYEDYTSLYYRVSLLFPNLKKIIPYIPFSNISSSERFESSFINITSDFFLGRLITKPVYRLRSKSHPPQNRHQTKILNK